MMWHDDCQTLLALDLPGVDSASLLSISLVAKPRGGGLAPKTYCFAGWDKV